MTPALKSLLVAAVHVALIASMGAKMLYDRNVRPRVWARVVPYDPDLPIRGRYVSLQIEVAASDIPVPASASQRDMSWRTFPVTLAKQNDRLVARKFEGPGGGEEASYVAGENHIVFRELRPKEFVPLLYQRLAYFIPEHAEDPSFRAAGEELWVEVTLPKKGPPRPIRLAVKTRDGTFTPLEWN